MSKKYKAIFIVGPRHNKKDIDLIRKKYEELYDKAEYLILGDGKKNLKIDDIKNKIDGRVDKSTRIDIQGHGGIKERGGVHAINVVKGKNGKNLSTGDLLKQIFPEDQYNKGDVNVNIFSCYAGYAVEDIRENCPHINVALHGKDTNSTMIGNNVTAILGGISFHAKNKVFLKGVENDITSIGQTVTTIVAGKGVHVSKYSTEVDYKKLKKCLESEIIEFRKIFGGKGGIKFSNKNLSLYREVVLVRTSNGKVSDDNLTILSSYLLGNNISTECKNKSLARLARKLDVESFQSLNANLNSTGSHGTDITALHHCVKRGSLEGVNNLIGVGADLDVRVVMAGIEYSPLRLAISRNNTKIVKALIKGGADVNKKFQQTDLLSVAVSKGNINIINALIDGGAKIDRRLMRYDVVDRIKYLAECDDKDGKLCKIVNSLICDRNGNIVRDKYLSSFYKLPDDKLNDIFSNALKNDCNNIVTQFLNSDKLYAIINSEGIKKLLIGKAVEELVNGNYLMAELLLNKFPEIKDEIPTLYDLTSFDLIVDEFIEDVDGKFPNISSLLIDSYIDIINYEDIDCLADIAADHLNEKNYAMAEMLLSKFPEIKEMVMSELGEALPKDIWENSLHKFIKEGNINIAGVVFDKGVEKGYTISSYHATALLKKIIEKGSSDVNLENPAYLELFESILKNELDNKSRYKKEYCGFRGNKRINALKKQLLNVDGISGDFKDVINYECRDLNDRAARADQPMQENFASTEYETEAVWESSSDELTESEEEYFENLKKETNHDGSRPR